ncbi:enoyl-CoA hydratase/isomerase family protein [Allopusillimonas ginsengisoli]|uniref:enoyl-CoA hydratase/isomerase family protein n=1 Tax=Allopusillimonas ginsengisoli TaxID=453575 RepID=UPI0010201093|nr:enoyl-CoA hydratase/isomerase family protein [Allopusillimonas ginsengisoli]TEA78863.1 enoyl-CoA hydratase/isomerase family protein [Allopusillimonas ginsengisoli]
MINELIKLDIQSGIATIYLNRPEKRNAFSDEMRSEYLAVLQEVASNRDVRAVVLTGTGKGFCAGGDVEGMEARMQAEPGQVGFNGWTRQQRVHQCVSLLHSMPKPTIAAVNGAASGLGADTAISCDFVLASEAATFAWSYINRGLIPDGGGLYLLPRRVGLPTAKDLIFSGRRLDAREALQLGIADRVVESEALLPAAWRWAEEVSGGSATALALGKAILNQTFELSASQVLAQGSQAQAVCYTSHEHRESVRAFLKQRDERRAVATTGKV